MYGIISKYYGTAGKVYIEKLIDEYEGKDYKKLRDKYNEIFKRIETETDNDILSYVSSVSIVTLADMLIGKWLFNEDEEKSFEMASEILQKLDKAKEIDIVDKCYEYITSWIKGNHKSFDTYKENVTQAQKTYAKLHREDDLTETDRTKRSFGIYDKNKYYVLRYILEDKLNSLGYSYKKMTKEFAKRKYIEPDTKNEKLISITQQKKYRGTNTRFFVFPVEMMDKELTAEEREKLEKDYDAQTRGNKDWKDWEKCAKTVNDMLNENTTEFDKEISELEIIE